MSECQTKAGNQKCFVALSHSQTLSFSHSITLNMLNNFCFPLYAQKSLFITKMDMVFFDINGFF